MSAIPDEFLSLLHRFRPDGIGDVIVLDAEALPSRARGLLVHDGDMTSRLEALHADGIWLDVVNSVVADDGGYFREVILRRIADLHAVEYGVIEIVLKGFSQHLRGQIVDGKVPLGGLLNRDKLGYFSEPQRFFKVHPNVWMRETFGVADEGELYGRCNILKRLDGFILERIVEVLPTLVSNASVAPKSA